MNEMNSIRKAIVYAVVFMTIWVCLLILMFMVDIHPGWMNEYPFTYVLVGISIVILLLYFNELAMYDRRKITEN